jgi:hypothetical protein
LAAKVLLARPKFEGIIMRDCWSDDCVERLWLMELTDKVIDVNCGDDEEGEKDDSDSDDEEEEKDEGDCA